ncbi:trypsin-like peptidase domain-containing protein [Sedimentisphaera salicampi]|uniref:Putative periplasmic serine endoprotease DegP-like n=1 Tax=Sedimentisphaera salicampi TaxID=1941349 RepID=A0A1W6LJA0_9BACT|nr:trypsin-like peptidase domain-containing protein [Sedimentisphaera salicampi]ARN55868.1 putative periplasmic serine endoprotease DegP-like precursor [Sedimentisphaera salicampi]
MKRSLFAAVLVSLIVPFSASAGMTDSFSNVVEKVNPAVVFIEVTQEREVVSSPFKEFDWIPWDRGQREAPEKEKQIIKGSGSGAIIDAEKGYVLTAAHVIKDVDAAVVHLPDGREFEAIDFIYDTQTDVGVVQIDTEGEKLPEISFGDSDEVKVGDWVLAMGSPLGEALANSVSAGIVSGKGRKSGILGKLGIENFIQTDAVINKGNSGGPLVNTDGEIIGINSNIISRTGFNAGLGFAVPSNIASDVVEKLITEGVIVRGWLGVTVSPLDAIEDEDMLEEIPERIMDRGGAYIVDVLDDGPADEADMEAGDIVLSINGEGVKDASELIKIISSMEPETEVEIQIFRDGEKEELEVTLGIRPGTGRQGGKGVVTGKDRETESFKKIGIAIERYNEQGEADFSEGAVVRYVRPDSIAEQFGIEVGDRIMEVNGEGFEEAEDFQELIEDADLEDGILLNVVTKNDKERKVYLKEF